MLLRVNGYCVDVLLDDYTLWIKSGQLHLMADGLQRMDIMD